MGWARKNCQRRLDAYAQRHGLAHAENKLFFFPQDKLF
jgi:hypothetical protein